MIESLLPLAIRRPGNDWQRTLFTVASLLCRPNDALLSDIRLRCLI